MRTFSFFILLSSISATFIHSSEEKQPTMSQTVEIKQKLKRIHIVIAASTPPSYPNARDYDIKPCTEAACITCSDKMNRSNWNW